jgi:DNA-binding NtrC family response regulator
MPNALLVEDDKSALEALTVLVERMGFSTCAASTWADAKTELSRQDLDVVLLDVMLPGGSGIDLLLDIPKERRPQVVMMSGVESVRNAFASFPMQELHFVQKPVDADVLAKTLAVVRRKIAPKGSTVAPPRNEGLARLLGDSPGMRQLRALVARVAPTDLSVYVQGESGTGKELVASLVHELSARRDRPFVALNCGAVPESLIDSELFGHEKGAFTGADRVKQGMFELADGGTLFLDEIAEMPTDLQVRLLRTLESKRLRRVGGNKEIEVDVRIIAATNRPFDEAIAQGKFREDLFHRLCVFPIVTPPLREHPEDIETLARHFLNEIEESTGRVKTLDPQTMALLSAYDWPGNVRQLRNVVLRAHVMADQVITPECLPEQFTSMSPIPAGPAGSAGIGGPAGIGSSAAIGGSARAKDSGNRIELPVGTSIAEAERRLIEATIQQHSGDKRAAAEILGVSLRTLYNRLKEYDGERTAPPTSPAPPAPPASE